MNRKKEINFENQFVGKFEVVSIAIMHKVTTERKTFSKIRVAIDGPVDYAANIASDYDAQLIILHVFNFHEIMIIRP